MARKNKTRQEREHVTKGLLAHNKWQPGLRQAHPASYCSLAAVPSVAAARAYRRQLLLRRSAGATAGGAAGVAEQGVLLHGAGSDGFPQLPRGCMQGSKGGGGVGSRTGRTKHTAGTIAGTMGQRGCESRAARQHATAAVPSGAPYSIQRPTATVSTPAGATGSGVQALGDGGAGHEPSTESKLGVALLQELLASLHFHRRSRPLPPPALT